MSRNQLAEQTSPYLLLHKDNPIHWRPWGEEALEEARSSGKPIMLSIGFTACHGCELMNRDTFSDPAIAALMNEHFVCIKVDREERPDVDQVYQMSLTLLTGGKGGWPLTGFLTPEGDMYYGGTYFPPVDRPDSPSFSTLLNGVLKLRADEPQNVEKMVARVNAHYADQWNRDFRVPLTQAPIDEAALRIGQSYDMFYGGLQGPAKFPNYPHVELMIRAYLRTGTMQFNALAQTTLTALCMGGIYDHVGGGIMRNAADDRWVVPHFEKMLVDNAQFIDLLTLAWQLDRNPLYLARIEETIAWLQRDMAVDHAFAASRSSVSDGEEGKYYVWSEAEIDAALAGTFSQKFKAIYGVTSQGNFNGRNVLARASGQAMFNLNKADEALLAKQREILRAERNKRVAPERDDKVLADWNGMLIAALANAGAVFRRADWTLAATRAFDFIEKALGDGDRLYHSWRNGKRQHIGFADDYAHMARAALTLWETTNDPRYLERARAWVRTLNEHFWDSSYGGYFFTADDSDPLIARPRSGIDLSQPSANGIMPAVLGKLTFFTVDDAYRNACNQLLEAFAGQISANYISMASYINSMETVVMGLQIVVVGSLTNPKTHELMSAVLGRALPNRLLVRVDTTQELPEGHPAFGKPMQGGLPTAYICQRNNCSPPITNPVTLSQALQLPQRQQPQQQQQMPQPAGRA
jgi:uncharacterized protein YyaL (SSP411 family)